MFYYDISYNNLIGYFIRCRQNGRTELIMYEDFFAQRITELRLQKNVSAREMSLALGQNGSYINRIENKQAFPSMQAFFYICEYFGITPREFFDSDNLNPTKLAEIVDIVSGLNEEQLDIVLFVAKGLSDKTKP